MKYIVTKTMLSISDIATIQYNLFNQKSYKKLILNNNLPPAIHDMTPLPTSLEEHRQLIVRNYKLISFEEQVKRLKFP